MEIDNYRNFLAIVEAGSMTSASEFVHIAQPALSKQLKSLEGYFGTKLIITTRKQASDLNGCRKNPLPQGEVYLFTGRYGTD